MVIIFTIVNVSRAEGAVRPIQHERDAGPFGSIMKKRLVVTVDFAATAVLRGTIESVHEFAIESPNADAHRSIVSFRDPELLPAVDGEAEWMVHVMRIVRAGL